MTAVEWLENYIDKEINKYSRQPMDLNAIHALNHIKHYTCKQAKEMEKEQIMQAVYDSMGTNFDPNMGRAELYYNETYNKSINNKG